MTSEHNCMEPEVDLRYVLSNVIEQLFRSIVLRRRTKRHSPAPIHHLYVYTVNVATLAAWLYFRRRCGRCGRCSISIHPNRTLSGHLADKPTRGQSSRGLDDSRTSQLADSEFLKSMELTLFIH